MDFEVKKIKTKILIVGGGTAGCYAALSISRKEKVDVVIAEKANIIRSGCLAAGVNALNAYISKGHVPNDYVEYAKKDGEGIVRPDLLLTLAELFNEVTEDLEKMGLVILKDENGEYVTRGWRNVKINGENIKPLLADAVSSLENVKVFNQVNITDLKLGIRDGKKAVVGAVGFGVRKKEIYDIDADAVIVATGGAAGLYRPNNPGFSRHKMWYSPFNTGAGFAMGLRAGAEMTTFENRFVALRCKDTIAPTGTIAQGVGAKQVNANGEIYEQKYGLTTPQRIYGTVEENRQGKGPCYLKTSGITDKQEDELYKAYLNMAPSQTLKWIEEGRGPKSKDVEIEGTEPYIVGGHTASGYWVDTHRQSTVSGLFAAGDVAGGAPQKYVTGALAEGKIAGESALDYVKKASAIQEMCAQEWMQEYQRHFEKSHSMMSWEDVEEAMQKVMDEYAGGIATGYRYNEARLEVAREKIKNLQAQVENLFAKDMFDLLHIYEVRERLLVCEVLIEHLFARKETRWHIFGENADYPEKDQAFDGYINSKIVDGKVEIVFRDLVGGHYEHTN